MIKMTTPSGTVAFVAEDRKDKYVEKGYTPVKKTAKKAKKKED